MRREINEKKSAWLAIAIGCIECGEDTQPIGLFLTKAQADDAAQAATQTIKAKHRGQLSFKVFEVDASPILGAKLDA